MPSKEQIAYVLLSLNIGISALAIYTAHFVKLPDLVIKLDFYLSIIIPLYLAIVFLSIIFTNLERDESKDRNTATWYNIGIILSLVIAIIYFSSWYLSS